MTHTFDTVLADYHRRAEAEADERLRSTEPLLETRDRYLLHVGEDVGRFLHALVIGRRAQRIIELGTSYGYSTLFLADAARQTGGRVVTLDLSAKKQAEARAQLDRVGLADHVEWRTGDALEQLAQLDGPFDFVLLDLWKELYVPSLDLIYPKLANGGVIAADNILLPEVVRPQAAAYRAAVRARPDLETMLLPIGQGIELTCRNPWPSG